MTVATRQSSRPGPNMTEKPTIRTVFPVLCAFNLSREKLSRNMKATTSVMTAIALIMARVARPAKSPWKKALSLYLMKGSSFI